MINSLQNIVNVSIAKHVKCFQIGQEYIITSTLYYIFLLSIDDHYINESMYLFFFKRHHPPPEKKFNTFLKNNICILYSVIENCQRNSKIALNLSRPSGSWVIDQN